MISEAKIKVILDKIDEARAECLRRGVIILTGPFQSGKTTILKRYLERHRLSEKDYLLAVNSYLLKCLGNDYPEMDSGIAVLAKLKSKTQRLFEQYLQQFFEGHFKQHNLLLIDAVELLFDYNVNLIQLIYQFCQEGTIAVISLPQDEKHGFALNWTFGLSKIIDLSA